MRVLVLGANGFVGSAIVAALIRAGIEVRGVVRDPAKLSRRFPDIDTFKADLLAPSARDAGFWQPALDGIDAVVNAAGVLRSRRERDTWAVHVDAPDALYAGCMRQGVKRIIQISAIGVEEATTVYARSKRTGDDKLMARDLDWTILRPVIVIGHGSYGGTSMLRAIAAFPWVTPVIADGGNALEFIHTDDLAAAIVGLLSTGAGGRQVLEPASPERLTLLEAVHAYRRWLGRPQGPVVRVPDWSVTALARLGDLVKLDPITTTAVTQFRARLTGDAEEFEAATGVRARGLHAVLADRPAESQDLWHARLYLVRPVIRLTLAVLWLVSGLLGLFAEPARYIAILAPITESQSFATALAVSTSLLDLAIAAALLFGWQLKAIANVQLFIVLGYTVALSLLSPGLWGDLFGSLLKNLPIIALILVHRILEEER